MPGIRFYYMTPTQSDGDDVAVFKPGEWGQRPGADLYAPVSTPQGRRARQPERPGRCSRRCTSAGSCRTPGTSSTACTCSTARRRTVIRSGSAPRVGFAWDVTGDGKTAIRGGAGIFYDRYNDDNILDLIELPPLLNTYRTNYTTISELLSSPLTATPTTCGEIEPFKPPVVHNWSRGVQRDIGLNLVGDAAYVGNAGAESACDHRRSERAAVWLRLPAAESRSDQRLGGQPQPLTRRSSSGPYQGFGRASSSATSPATPTITRCSSR